MCFIPEINTAKNEPKESHKIGKCKNASSVAKIKILLDQPNGNNSKYDFEVELGGKLMPTAIFSLTHIKSKFRSKVYSTNAFTKECSTKNISGDYFIDIIFFFLCFLIIFDFFFTVFTR